jgi:hypothetical protein
VKANTILLGDHVVVSRGKDVAEGPRLKVDLTSGMYRFELESERAAVPQAPATMSSPPLTTPTTSPTSPSGRACPPGKQCLLFFPKEAREKVEGAVKKALPNGAAGGNWEPGTSASPVQRSD